MGKSEHSGTQVEEEMRKDEEEFYHNDAEGKTGKKF